MEVRPWLSHHASGVASGERMIMIPPVPAAINSVERIGCPLLSRIFDTNYVETADGRKLPLDGNIPIDFAGALYGAVLAAKPRCVLEIGMGYGIATLTILAALKAIGGERKLITID